MLEEQAVGFCPDSMGPPPQAKPDGTDGRRLKAGRRLKYAPDANWTDGRRLKARRRRKAGRRLEYVPDANGTDGRRLKAGRRLEYVPDASGDGSGMKGARVGQEVYSLYLYEHEGQDRALEKIDALEEEGWIDLNTAWVGGKLLIFNPTLAI